jgi:hypothetical protein
VRQCCEVAGGDVQVLGTDHAVHETNRELQAVGVLQDARELLGGGVHGDLGRFGQPVADQCDGFGGQGLRLLHINVNGLRRDAGSGCRLHCNVGHGFPDLSCCGRRSFHQYELLLT